MGVLVGLDEEVYAAIHTNFLDSHHIKAKKMIRRKRGTRKLARCIRYLRKRQHDILNQNNKIENPWLFERNSRKEIRDIVFLQAEESETPRLHSNANYQWILLAKIEDIIEKQRLKDIAEGSPNSSSVGMTRTFSLVKRESISKTKEEVGTVPMDSRLQLIRHANELTEKRYDNVLSQV